MTTIDEIEEQYIELKEIGNIIVTTAKLMGYEVKQIGTFTIINRNGENMITFSFDTRTLAVSHEKPKSIIQETKSQQKKIEMLNKILQEL